MPKRILDEDWSDYDNCKKKQTDGYFFSCDEDWEVEYLTQKIKKYYPLFTIPEIRLAITSCRHTVPAPRPRERFVNCVINRLTN